MAAEKIPGWIERLLLPKLNEISGDIKAVNSRIDSLEDRIGGLETNLNIKIDSLRNETKTEIVSLKTETKTEIGSIRIEITSLRTEMILRLDSLEKRIPVIEELTALKIRIADIEKRMAVV